MFDQVCFLFVVSLQLLSILSQSSKVALLEVEYIVFWLSVVQIIVLFVHTFSSQLVFMVSESCLLMV